MRGRWSAIAAFLSIAMRTRAALGYRPFVSTDAAVADTGEAEIELGYIGFRRRGDRSAIVAPTVIGNLGIAPDLELVAEFKLVNDLGRRDGTDRTRFEDSAISLKWVARDGALQGHGSTPSLGVELSALLPTIRGQDRPGGELVGIASGRTLGWTYHLNGGALVEPGGAEPGVIWGLIAEHGVWGRLRAVAELNGEAVRGGEADTSALAGAIWDVPAPPPLHELSFDIGVRHGISRTADEWGGTAGVTFALPWRAR
jgi:hypothetical protein